MNTTNTCICDICGKEFLSDNEKNLKQLVVCDDCQKALNSDKEEVGDDNGNS